MLILMYLSCTCTFLGLACWELLGTVGFVKSIKMALLGLFNLLQGVKENFIMGVIINYTQYNKMILLKVHLVACILTGLPHGALLEFRCLFE